MVEKLLEDDTLFDSPFLRRIRKGREEEEGRRRAASSPAAKYRGGPDVAFAPPAAIVQQVTQHVEAITDEAALERLFTAAVRSANLAEFQTAMTQG